MATEVLQLGIDSTGALSGARQFERAATSVQQSATKADGATKKMDGGFNRLRSSAMTLTRTLGALGITIGAGALVRSIARATADMDTLRLSLDAVTGSSVETARQLKALREVAKLPGLGFKEAVQGAVNLEVVGFSAKETIRVLKDFGNAVALTGGGKNELDRIIFQFTQMSSLGKVTSQDLKPILQTAPAVAKAMLGVFGTISPEKIEAMGLTFDQFVARLLTGLEKLPHATGGVKNAFENLSDAVFQASAAFGTEFSSAVGGAINKLAGALQSFADNRRAIIDVADAVKALTKAFAAGGLIYAAVAATKAMAALTVASGAAAFFQLIPAITGAADALTLFGFAAKAALGPIGLLVGAVGLATYFYTSGRAARDAAADLDAFAASLTNLHKQELLVEQFKLNDQASRIQERLGGVSSTKTRTIATGLGTFGTVREKNPEFVALNGQLDTVIRKSVAVANALAGIVEPAKGGGGGTTPRTAEEVARTIAEKLERAFDGLVGKFQLLIPRLANGDDIIAARGGLGAAGLLGLPASSPVSVPGTQKPRDTFGLRLRAAGGYLSQGFDALKAGDIAGVGRSVIAAAGALGPLAIAAAALAPVFKGLKDALGPAITGLAKPLEIIGRLIGGTIAPLLKLLEAPLTFLAKVISYVNEAFGYLIYGLAKFVDKLVPFGDPLKAVEKYGQDIIQGARDARAALNDMGTASDKVAASLSTDLPHAINLALYRSRIGAPAGGGSVGAPGGGGTTPGYRPPYVPPGVGDGHLRPAPVESGTVTISIGQYHSAANETPEDAARKMAKGAQILASQGVRLYAPGLVTAA